jgi:hypothetical protein
MTVAKDPGDVWQEGWEKEHGHALAEKCSPACEGLSAPNPASARYGDAIRADKESKNREFVDALERSFDGAVGGEAQSEGKGDLRGETTLDPVASHKLLKHLSRMLTWAYREALTTHTAIPRVAAGQIAYKLAERHLEEFGGELCKWVGEVSRGH